MLRMRFRGVRLLVDSRQSHHLHQTADPLAIDGMPKPSQVPCHLPGSVPRGFEVLFVYQAHQFQVFRAFAHRLVVVGRSIDREQFALPGNTELDMAGFNQAFPSGSTQRHFPKAFTKKSRSTVSCPILACNSLI